MKRLVIFIIIFAIFLVFIVLNLNNKCDISIGFKTFKDIPVFLSSLFSFVLGMFFTLPLIITLGKEKKKKIDTSSSSPSGAGGKKRGKLSETDEYNKDNSPYGID